MKRPLSLFLVPALGAGAALVLPVSGCGEQNAAAGPGGLPLCGDGAATSAAPAAPACESNPADYPYPFWDPCQPLEARLANLLATLTIDEKLSLLAGSHNAIPRISLPAASLGTEALHGLGIAANPNAPTGSFMPMSTQFPQVFGLGESWDPDVMKTVGATVGYEARVYNARGIADSGRGIGIITRGPNVDLVHDPRWGRTEESFGEDPFLVGEMAKGYLAGLHGDDPTYLRAACTLKHFAANSNETTRLTSSSNVDARNLREYYTATFRTAVREGHADGIMTAYNQINGVPAGVSPILRGMVRGEWGFEGFFSTDGQAATHWVQDQQYFPDLDHAIGAAVAETSGVLLQSNVAPNINEAYAMGLITDADVDAAVGPALRIRFRTGDFDPPARVPYKAIQSSETPWATDEAKARALDVTRRTIVLLKNADRTLPLDAKAIKSVAVIGPRADSVVRDWYGGTPPYPYVTGRQGIVNKVGANGVTVYYALNDNGGGATSAAALADVAVVFVGNHPTCGEPYPPWGTCPSPYEGREQVDRLYIGLDPEQLALVQSVAAANPRTIVVLVSSFPQGIGWIDEHVPAIVHVTNSGQELGNAVADVLFGDYNPGGHTTTTWYQSETDIPTALTDYDIKRGTTYWYFTGAPLYPFGYGLSYASFEYSNLTVSADALPACGSVEVGVDVTNTSAVAGDEVVQLYISYPGSSVQRPLQQLRGFRRVNVAAGATAHVTMSIAAADLSYWDERAARFTVEYDKPVELQVGASSRDIRMRATLPFAR
ncbi:MAG TPA: glycoside hydrolase family 3 C-terminal domain-containing protein [Polyangia bacterium]|nr:glycoside hydrolase family 3 C-terminal domain-containing protein [Polyangia bacterium]